MDLIIVESPSKAKTISKYLKGKYRVDASGGHIRDLPQKTLGVAIDKNFEPRYVTSIGKEETVKRLADEAKRADRIFLATDPDREGEAISWHLQTVLGLDAEGKNRIEFNEISPKAVERALKNPRTINYNLVDAQQARRVMDRLVGYKLSPLLNNKIQNGLSAGRVQSVALRLVVDREREIQAFVPEEYWSIHADLQDTEKKFAPFKALLEKCGDKKFKVGNKEEADAVLAALAAGNYTVASVKKAITKSHAPAPFTTSTLQQDASNKLGMTAPETMLMAQHLYEGIDVGGEHIAFVTYIRTDSTRVSEEAQAAAREYIKTRYGEDYVPEKPNHYATKKQAQDAHEAIRPINLD
ncbi:MAG: type I DNA topoisomerase, partial [Clostridia bacterium]|nr:type I DNA topoisomerase [Clostridia bacterium]